MKWGFMVKILCVFSFSKVFIRCVNVVFKFAQFSILVNGSPHGYFRCERGVKQSNLRRRLKDRDHRLR